MKISPLALTTAILACTTSSIEARGRGNGGSSKGKSAVEEVDPCECDGPISTQIYTDGSAPLFTIQEANAAAPEGCVLKVPSDLDLQLVPPPGGTGGFIVPVVADIATVGACVDPASCIGNGGRRLY